MELSILIGTLSAASVMASPAAGQLKRALKDVTITAAPALTDTPASNVAIPTTDVFQIACVECPCGGFDGNCECVFQGCCCDWTIPGQPPTTGWRKAADA